MNRATLAETAPRISAIPAARGAARSDEIDLGALISTLWRGKLVIALCVLIGIFSGGYYAYIVAEPTYQATAVLMLNSREEQVVDLERVIGGLSSDRVAVNTEVEVLRSRGLIAMVVKRLSLTEDPEFNGRLQSMAAIDVLKEKVKSLLGMGTPSAPLSEEEEARRNEQATINGLLSALTIRNVAQSLVFQVTVESSDARKSARIADMIVESYITNQLDVKFEATEQATSWLTDRVAQLQQDLEDAENKVKDFRAQTDLISPDVLQGLEVQLKDLRSRIAGLQTDRVLSETRLASLQAARTPQEQAAASADTQLTQLLPRIGEPQIAQAFSNRIEQIEARIATDIERGAAQITALQRSQEELQGRIDRQSRDLITLQQLGRETEAVRLLYEYFLNRLKETSVQQGVQQADSRVLSDAQVPSQPASPRKAMIIGISLVLGFIAGAALVLLRELRADTFRTSAALEGSSGYQVMGQLPIIRARKRRDVLSYLDKKPTSALAEAVRNLRTSLLLAKLDQEPRVIMVSSSVPGEGKTTVSLVLAQNLARMGKKVLVIEGDIRRRAFSNYFDSESRAGLSDVIEGTASLEEAIYHSELLGADVFIGQKESVNAADLFSSRGFEDLIAKVRDLYDYVIIDTAPVLIVPDARILARVADASLLVVRWDRTYKTQVEEALNAFASVNRPISGLVLNQINPRGLKRYGYGNYYSGYSSYGRKYYTN